MAEVSLEQMATSLMTYYDKDIVNTFRDYCLEDVWNIEDIQEDIQEIDDSLIAEHMQTSVFQENDNQRPQTIQFVQILAFIITPNGRNVAPYQIGNVHTTPNTQQDRLSIADALVKIIFCEYDYDEKEEANVKSLQLKDEIIELVQHCRFNQLFEIYDFMNHCRIHGKLDKTFDHLLYDYLVNQRGFKFKNIKPLSSGGAVLKRMIPFIPILTRLGSGHKLPENPKPLQLLLGMMCYRVQQEIMAAYKHVDYKQENIISIDTVAIYYPEMMELIKQKLNKLHKHGAIHMLDIPARDCDDSLFNDTNEFYTRLFSQIPAMVTKYGEDKYLIRIFVQLGKTDGILCNYSRTIISIEPSDEKMKKLINQQTYRRLVDNDNCIDIYPVLLAKKRLEWDLEMLRRELPEPSDENIETLLASDYNMFTTIMYPQKLRDSKKIFRRKMYNLFSNGIIRFKEEDINIIIPNYFEGDLLLEDEQLSDIVNWRGVKRMCYNDTEFEHLGREVLSYKHEIITSKHRLHLRPNNANYPLLF